MDKNTSSCVPIGIKHPNDKPRNETDKHESLHASNGIHGFVSSLRRVPHVASRLYDALNSCSVQLETWLILKVWR